jgi:hypothetical protein
MNINELIQCIKVPAFLITLCLLVLSAAASGGTFNDESVLTMHAKQEKEDSSLAFNKPNLSGFVDFNLYYDSRKFGVVTINTLLRFPHRFQYFSLVNYSAPLDSGTPTDMESFYTEQNIRWGIHSKVPLDLTLQWILRSGASNDMLRLGFRWRVSNTPGIDRIFNAIGMFYAVNFHTYQLDFVSANGWRWQIEHVYKFQLLEPWLKDRVYIAGFIDHNLWIGGDDADFRSRVVTEHQLGIRVFGGLHIVGEYRYNGFLSESRHGFGAGIQYLAPFELKPIRKKSD